MSEDFHFTRPTDQQMPILCVATRLLCKRVAEKYPHLHASQFVSEAGLRRGVAVSRDPLPPTFVLLSNEKGGPGTMTAEQTEMLRLALVMYVGADDAINLSCCSMIPIEDPDDVMDGVSQWLSTEFQSIVSQIDAHFLAPFPAE